MSLKSRRYALIDAFPVKEILAFILVFVGAMVALFPGWTMKKLLLKRKITNLKLYVKYLEAISSLYPSPEFMEALALGYARLGRYKDAIAVVEKLKAHPLYRKNISRLEYEILKMEFFTVKYRDKKALIKKKLRRALLNIVVSSSDRKTLEWAFREAVAMDVQDVALEVSYKLALLTKQRKWIKESISRAFYRGEHGRVLKLVEQLGFYDGSVFPLVIRSALAMRDYKKARALLNSYLEKNPENVYLYAKDLVELTLKLGKGKGRILFRIIDKAKTVREKKKIIRIAIEHALWKSDYKLVKRIIDKYATRFLEDKAFTNYLLRTALATGDPIFAGEIAEKVGRALGVIKW